MKTLKKALLTVIVAIIALLVTGATSKATTVKVTGDTLNIRKSPSTSSSILDVISKGVECELLEEDGEWYKIKYKNYTGYISKQYSQIVENNEEKTNSQDLENNNQQANSNEQNNQTGENNQTEPKDDNTNQNTTDGDANSNTADNDDSQNNKSEQITYKKFSQDCKVKILPLIHSNDIGELKKDSQVILLTQTTLWSYVQADTISGWVRNTYLLDSTAPSLDTQTPDNKQNENNNQTSQEKTAYINEEYVNLRKGASTNTSVVKVLKLNSQITIIGEEGSWYKVKSGSDTGYISKEFVSDTKKVTSRSSSVPRTQESENNKEEEKNNDSATDTKPESTANTVENNTVTSEQDTKSTKSDTIKGTDIVAYAKQYLGHKYVYGGDGSNGTFDCSGFTMYVYKHFGISLPHGATSQYKSGKGTKISKQNQLQIGDIVFLTEYGTGKGIGHCGIYIGNGNFIHSSTTTYTVTISSLNTTYAGRFYAGLRLI